MSRHSKIFPHARTLAEMNVAYDRECDRYYAAGRERDVIGARLAEMAAEIQEKRKREGIECQCGACGRRKCVTMADTVPAKWRDGGTNVGAARRPEGKG